MVLRAGRIAWPPQCRRRERPRLSRGIVHRSPFSSVRRENACQHFLGFIPKGCRSSRSLGVSYLSSTLEGPASPPIFDSRPATDSADRSHSVLIFFIMTKISTAVNGKDAFRPVFMRVRATFEGHSLQCKQPTRLLYKRFRPSVSSPLD